MANAVEQYGRLHVEGTRLCGEHGESVQLRGVSTHAISLYPQYINKEAFETFQSWGANAIRLAMYTEEDRGYLTDGNQKAIQKLIDQAVSYTKEFGMYVIIDWHTLKDNNPLEHVEQAKVFWNMISDKYKECPHVIYEMCNEPNGEEVTWEVVKEYAKQIIPVIRANDKEALLLIGTPTWSQDVDIAAQSPITEESNIMYTLHFYAATHKQALRDKAQAALQQGLPLFISEFGICDASGNGVIDYEETAAWMQFAREHNLSYFCWNISNKDESSAYFIPECQSVAAWKEEELRETGKFIKSQLQKDAK